MPHSVSSAKPPQGNQELLRNSTPPGSVTSEVMGNTNSTLNSASQEVKKPSTVNQGLFENSNPTMPNTAGQGTSVVMGKITSPANSAIEVEEISDHIKGAVFKGLKINGRHSFGTVTFGPQSSRKSFEGALGEKGILEYKTGVKYNGPVDRNLRPIEECERCQWLFSKNDEMKRESFAGGCKGTTYTGVLKYTDGRIFEGELDGFTPRNGKLTYPKNHLPTGVESFEQIFKEGKATDVVKYTDGRTFEGEIKGWVQIKGKLTYQKHQLPEKVSSFVQFIVPGNNNTSKPIGIVKYDDGRVFSGFVDGGYNPEVLVGKELRPDTSLTLSDGRKVALTGVIRSEITLNSGQVSSPNMKIMLTASNLLLPSGFRFQSNTFINIYGTIYPDGHGQAPDAFDAIITLQSSSHDGDTREVVYEGPINQDGDLLADGTWKWDGDEDAIRAKVTFGIGSNKESTITGHIRPINSSTTNKCNSQNLSQFCIKDSNGNRYSLGNGEKLV